MSKLRGKGLKPISEMAKDRDHGDRLKYMAGCKCMLCRAANSRYECQRAAARKAGDWNGIVSATPARKHILKLQAAGVGRKSIAAASDIRAETIRQIRTGKKKKIRKRIETRILAVTEEARGGNSIVPAGPTWDLIGRLEREGFTEADLAQRLGYKTPKLQFKKDFIVEKNAVKVERLYRLLTGESAPVSERLNKQSADGQLGHEIKCGRCGDFWPADEEFWFRSGTRGLHNRCKACYLEWRAENKQKNAAKAEEAGAA